MVLSYGMPSGHLNLLLKRVLTRRRNICRRDPGLVHPFKQRVARGSALASHDWVIDKGFVLNFKSILKAYTSLR